MRSPTSLSQAEAAFREVATRCSIRPLWDEAGTVPGLIELMEGVSWVCTPAFHAVGTCRTGRPTDPRSVVDPSARALGVDGLHAASVMPPHVLARVLRAS